MALFRNPSENLLRYLPLINYTDVRVVSRYHVLVRIPVYEKMADKDRQLKIICISLSEDLNRSSLVANSIIFISSGIAIKNQLNSPLLPPGLVSFHVTLLHNKEYDIRHIRMCGKISRYYFHRQTSG